VVNTDRIPELSSLSLVDEIFAEYTTTETRERWGLCETWTEVEYNLKRLADLIKAVQDEQWELIRLVLTTPGSRFYIATDEFSCRSIEDLFLKEKARLCGFDRKGKTDEKQGARRRPE
jgi:hypothetical protein